MIALQWAARALLGLVLAAYLFVLLPSWRLWLLVLVLRALALAVKILPKRLGAVAFDLAIYATALLKPREEPSR